MTSLYLLWNYFYRDRERFAFKHAAIVAVGACQHDLTLAFRNAYDVFGRAGALTGRPLESNDRAVIGRDYVGMRHGIAQII